MTEHHATHPLKRYRETKRERVEQAAERWRRQRLESESTTAQMGEAGMLRSSVDDGY